MAIIRLDCNLNGGDSVTPNNELFYRIYGDVDAYASPIHTTGTALSDANVTVNNDNVIITGVDGTTNTSFKIAAVDGAGNEGILSDAVSGTIIIFEDTFDGTVVDTTKWGVNNVDGYVTQNNELIMDCPDVQLADTNNVYTLNGYQGVAFSFDVEIPNYNGSYQWGVLIRNYLGTTVPGTYKQVYFDRTLTAGEVECHFRDEVGIIQTDTWASNISTYKTFKVVFTGSSCTFYEWTGVWTSRLTIAQDWTSETMYVRTVNKSSVSDPSEFRLDNVYITNSDFATQYPI